jgi:hypothetical protein
MIKTEGAQGLAPIECINKILGKYVIRFNEVKRSDGMSDYWSEVFDHKPTLDEIKQVIISKINASTQEIIQGSMTYQGNTVWLSQENQLNYTADLLTGTIPTIKLGTDNEELYKFTSLDEFKDFVTKVREFINEQIEENRAIKEKIDWSVYEI